MTDQTRDQKEKVENQRVASDLQNAGTGKEKAKVVVPGVRPRAAEDAIHNVVVLEDEHNPGHRNIAEEKEVQQAGNAHGIGRGVSDEFRLFSLGDFRLAHGKCATDHVVFTALSFFAV